MGPNALAFPLCDSNLCPAPMLGRALRIGSHWTAKYGSRRCARPHRCYGQCVLTAAAAGVPFVVSHAFRTDGERRCTRTPWHCRGRAGLYAALLHTAPHKAPPPPDRVFLKGGGGAGGWGGLWGGIPPAPSGDPELLEAPNKFFGPD